MISRVVTEKKCTLHRQNTQLLLNVLFYCQSYYLIARKWSQCEYC